MNKFLKIVTVIAGLTAVATASYFVATPRLEQWVTSKIRTTLEAKGVKSQIDDLRISGVDAKATRLVINFPAALLSFEAGNLQINPDWQSILTGVLSSRVQAELYGGTLRIDATYHSPKGSNIHDAITINGTISGIQIARHQQMRAAGIASGTLSIVARELKISLPTSGSTPSVEGGDLTVTIEGLALPKTIQLRGGAFIPPIANLNSTLIVSRNPAGLALSKIEVVSPSLGSASGTGQIDLVSDNIVTGFIVNLAVKLEDSIGMLIGGFLPALSDKTVPSNARQFNLELKGERGTVNIRLAPKDGF